MRRVSLLLCIAFFYTTIYAQNIVSDSGLEKGKYSVGFQIQDLKDYTRTSVSSSQIKNRVKYRDIRMYIWYPSIGVDKDYLSLEDFIRFSIEDYGQISSKDLRQQVKYASQFNRIPDEKIKHILEKKCLSIHNDPIYQDKFPVVILGQGLYYESPLSHLILCEYLASHGYVVVTCPLMGTNKKEAELNSVDFETQIRDLEFALSKVCIMNNVNCKKISAIGFDLGAMAATVFQMRNSNIKALVSYDGGIIFKHNIEQLLEDNPHYKPIELDVPALMFTRFKEENVQMGLQEDNSLIQHSLLSTKIIVRTKGMKHSFYTSLPSLEIESKKSPDIATKAYPEICNYTLEFLNHYIKEDTNSIDLLAKHENFVKNGVDFQITKVDATETLIQSYNLESVVLDHGLSCLFELCEEKQKVTEDELNVLAYRLLYNYSRSIDAIKIFEYVVEKHPKSANAYDSLGEAYLFIKDYESALKAYESSLELNNQNENAKRIVSQLKQM